MQAIVNTESREAFQRTSPQECVIRLDIGSQINVTNLYNQWYSVRMAAVNLMTTWYAVEAGISDVLIVTTAGFGAGNGTWTLTIPRGTYNASDLVSVLTSLLVTARSGATDASFMYNGNRGQIFGRVTAAGTMTIELTNAASTASRLVGGGRYPVADVVAVSGTDGYMPNMAEMTIRRNVNICVEWPGVIGLTQKNGGLEVNRTSKIPVMATLQAGGLGEPAEVISNPTFLCSAIPQFIRVSVQDDDGIVMNLNGVDFSMMFHLEGLEGMYPASYETIVKSTVEELPRPWQSTLSGKSAEASRARDNMMMQQGMGPSAVPQSGKGVKIDLNTVSRQHRS